MAGIVTPAMGFYFVEEQMGKSKLFDDDEFSVESLFDDESDDEKKLNLAQPVKVPRSPQPVGDKGRIQSRFEKFHRANPHVYTAIETLALGMKSRQWPKASISLIYERLRWIHAIRTKGGKYRLSNDYRAYYARLVMARNPKLRGFFGLRTQDNEYIIDWQALGMTPP